MSRIWQWICDINRNVIINYYITNLLLLKIITSYIITSHNYYIKLLWFTSHIITSWKQSHLIYVLKCGKNLQTMIFHVASSCLPNVINQRYKSLVIFWWFIFSTWILNIHVYPQQYQTYKRRLFLDINQSWWKNKRSLMAHLLIWVTIILLETSRKYPLPSLSFNGWGKHSLIWFNRCVYRKLTKSLIRCMKALQLKDKINVVSAIIERGITLP